MTRHTETRFEGMRERRAGRGRPEHVMAALFALGVLCVYLASAGGRIVASDEHTVFLLTRSLVERQSFEVSEGNTEQGPDGRLYAKAGLGQALASMPFYLAGKATAPLVPARLRGFYVRAATSLLGPVAGALLALVLVLLSLELGLTPRQSLTLGLVAALGTPLWVYAKLYLAEILLAAALGAELLGVLRWRRGGGPRSAALAAAGFGLALLTKYAVLPVALALWLPALPAFRRWRGAVAFVLVAGAFVALALHYNHVRTGSVWGTGYGHQATPAAFTTPLLIGLYGLLLSSGKGLAWFAPVAVLAPAGFVAWWRSDRWMALAAAAGVTVTALLYAGFEHWAGDGSWGPRYLVPLLPVLVAAVAARLGQREMPRRRVWWAAVAALGIAGAAVQVGGVGVYYGAQMREAGDYPYTLALDDPRFMSESHWNPYFSPIVGHWRMLGRNAAEHLRGRHPRVSTSAAAGGRLGIDEAQARALTRGFDVWAAYAVYAGLPAAAVIAVWLWLWVLAAGLLYYAWRDAAWISSTRAARAASATRGAPAPGEPPPMYEPRDAEERSRWSYLGKP